MGNVSGLKVLSKEQLSEIWLKKDWKEGETFHLYIHNPFCLTECTFCKHQGLRTKIGSDVYDKYYSQYLPELISHFGDAISSHPVTSVYFGGGTSSMMTPEIMSRIFWAIPTFDRIPHKTFECNPSLMDERKVDLLKENGFTYVSFGVQTFDERILLNNNRPAVRMEKLKRLVRRVQDHGMAINCDLITFIDRKDVSDLAQLERDLVILAEELGPDVITVYPETFMLRRAREADQIVMVGALRHCLKKFEVRYEGSYRLSKSNAEKLFSVDDIRANMFMDYRIYRRDLHSKRLAAVRSYNCSGGERMPATQNTLGLGSRSGEKDPPYSYMGKEFYCTEVNRGWVPEYHVHRDVDGISALAS